MKIDVGLVGSGKPEKYVWAAARQRGEPTHGPAAECRSVGLLQREPFPSCHAVGGPLREAERADEHQAANSSGNARSARRCERTTAGDAQQRCRVDSHRVQYRRRIVRPVRELT